MTLRKALDRTLLLMRDDVSASDEQMLHALTTTHVVLVADAKDLSSHSAQTAYVTAALLMARSGHTVTLLAPDVPLVGPQQPLRLGRMISALVEIGPDLLPGFAFRVGAPYGQVDVEVAFGEPDAAIGAERTVFVNATEWSASIGMGGIGDTWGGHACPFGGLAAGGLAAGEVFKAAMRKLRGFAKDQVSFDLFFAAIQQATFALAPEDTLLNPTIGHVDFVSGGAITSAALYSLARIPGVAGHGRLFEPDTADLSNLNRYALLRLSATGSPKAPELSRQLVPNLVLEPVGNLVDATLLAQIELAPTVVVGVDDIPSRWAVQRTNPRYLIVGATTHWSAMASFHTDGTGCAQCLHPTDDPGDAPIPTTACVSFWAGLLCAVTLVRQASGDSTPLTQQQIYLTPFQPEGIYRAPVPIRHDCPTCNSRVAA